MASLVPWRQREGLRPRRSSRLPPRRQQTPPLAPPPGVVRAVRGWPPVLAAAQAPQSAPLRGRLPRAPWVPLRGTLPRCGGGLAARTPQNSASRRGCRAAPRPLPRAARPPARSAAPAPRARRCAPRAGGAGAQNAPNGTAPLPVVRRASGGGEDIGSREEKQTTATARLPATPVADNRNGTAPGYAGRRQPQRQTTPRRERAG